jgi:hypothetical protein
MPTFWVPIIAPTGDDAERIAATLKEAGIAEVGPAHGGPLPHDLPEPRLYAKLDAADEAGAEARIREVVGEGPEIGPAGPARSG